MNIYQEKILDHYHDPRNYGKVKKPTHERCANNPTCGDTVETTLVVEDDTVKELKFSGEGCAISQAATSMVSEIIIGKKTEEVMKITRDDIIELLEVEIGLGRIRCALLGLETIQKAIENGKIEQKN